MAVRAAQRESDRHPVTHAGSLPRSPKDYRLAAEAEPDRHSRLRARARSRDGADNALGDAELVACAMAQPDFRDARHGSANRLCSHPGQRRLFYHRADRRGGLSGRALANLLTAGERIQRFWLTATRLGLAMQPALAVLSFAHYGENETAFTADPALQEKSRILASAFRKVFGAGTGRFHFYGSNRPASAKKGCMPLDPAQLARAARERRGRGEAEPGLAAIGAASAVRRSVVAQIERGADEREMRKGLREVAELAPVARDRTPPPAGRHRCAATEDARKVRALPLHALQHQLSASQKLQARKTPSPGGKPSRPRLRAIAQDEAIYRSTRARSPRPCRARADRPAAESQPAASATSSHPAPCCHSSARSCSSRELKPSRADVVMDGLAQRPPAIQRAFELPIPPRFGRRGRAPPRPSSLEKVKCRRVAAHLPNALVRLHPDLLEMLDQIVLRTPAVFRVRSPPLCA